MDTSPFWLEERHGKRMQAMLDQWSDEALDAALASNPRRALYLDWISQRAPAIVAERIQFHRILRARDQAEHDRQHAAAGALAAKVIGAGP